MHCQMLRGPALRERLDKTTLERLYVRVGLTTAQIATGYGSHTSTVLKLMDEYRIPGGCLVSANIS